MTDPFAGLTPAGWLIPLALSTLLPLAVFIGRHNVRNRRRAILEELKTTFRPALRGRGVQTFEMARARYRRRLQEDSFPERFAEFIHFLVPVAIFLVVSGVGFLMIYASLGGTFGQANFLLKGPQLPSGANLVDYQYGSVVLLAVAFSAAYLWSIGYLVLRIANFDLSPISFLRTSVHILLTGLTILVIRHSAGTFGGSGETSLGFLIVLAFLLGMFPRLGLNYLVDRMPSGVRLNRAVKEASEISRRYPLDLIDGVGANIKFRLGHFEIADAQNLATYNPIILFLETPYGLFKILDWISQAQLLLAVGPDRFLRLRALNVGNIRRLLAYGQDDEARKLLGPVLIDPPAGVAVTDAMIKAEIDAIAQELHVKRLMELCDAIVESMDAAPEEGLKAEEQMVAEQVIPPAPAAGNGAAPVHLPT